MSERKNDRIEALRCERELIEKYHPLGNANRGVGCKKMTQLLIRAAGQLSCNQVNFRLRYIGILGYIGVVVPTKKRSKRSITPEPRRAQRRGFCISGHDIRPPRFEPGRGLSVASSGLPALRRGRQDGNVAVQRALSSARRGFAASQTSSAPCLELLFGEVAASAIMAGRGKPILGSLAQRKTVLVVTPSLAATSLFEIHRSIFGHLVVEMTSQYAHSSAPRLRQIL